MTDIKKNNNTNKNKYKLNGGTLVFVKEKYAHEFTIPETKPTTTTRSAITLALACSRSLIAFR